MPEQYIVYRKENIDNNISSSEALATFGVFAVVAAAVVAAAAVAIGIIAFVGVAAFTSVASVVIPSVVKITTLSMATSELLNCLFLSAESLFIGAAFGFIKNLFHRKLNNYSSFSLENNKSLKSSIICNASIGMSIGFFSGISGINGIIQSTIFNVSINPQTIIGMVISSGGAGGIADSGGILLFLLLLLVFIIQGAIIGIIVGAFLGSFSGLLTSAVRHGIIETNIFLLNDSGENTGKEFLKFMLEGIVIGCLLGLLHGVITGKDAMKNNKPITNTNVKIEKPEYEPVNNFTNTETDTNFVNDADIFAEEHPNYEKDIFANNVNLLSPEYDDELQMNIESIPRKKIIESSHFVIIRERPILLEPTRIEVVRERPILPEWQTPEVVIKRQVLPDYPNFDLFNDTLTIQQKKVRISSLDSPTLNKWENYLYIKKRANRPITKIIKPIPSETENNNATDLEALPMDNASVSDYTEFANIDFSAMPKDEIK